MADDSGAADWRIVSVTCGQDCPEGDIVFASDQEVSLRAARSGRFGMRTYTIELQAEDEAGNLSAIETVTVLVPHARSQRGPRIR